MVKPVKDSAFEQIQSSPIILRGALMITGWLAVTECKVLHASQNVQVCFSKRGYLFSVSGKEPTGKCWWAPVYEEFPVANSSISMIAIIRVSPGPVLVRVVCMEMSLLDVTKAALCSCPHWKLYAFLVTLCRVTLWRVFVIIKIIYIYI